MITFVTAALAVYTLRLVFFLFGQLRHSVAVFSKDSTPTVSVIVPARNEEHTIERCLRALLASDYPADKLEIIVVNDRSTDGTEEVLNRLSATDGRVRALHRRNTLDHPNLKGKPGALQHGIDVATGDVLLLTDADCSVDKQWVRTLAQRFDDEAVGMVCGFTVIRTETLFDAVQDVEWLYTQTMARAGIRNGIPLGCFGNNMALRRRAYEAVGGYSAIPFSITEDLAILQVFTEAGWKVQYICDPSAVVETLPCDSLGEYLRQKHRWVRGGMALGSKAAVFVLTGAFYWVGICASILSGWWAVAALFLLLRILGDGLMIGTTIRRLGRWNRLAAVAPSIVLLLGLELLLPVMALRKTIVWKNQVFRQ